jgi:tRNA (mo5U34)-methyltransferase
MSIEEKILKKKWFYPFVLPSGRKTETHVPPEIEDIHPTRQQMIFSVLDPIYDGKWDTVTALDLGCNQGYFGFHLAEKGCKKVIGIEPREDLINDAEMIKLVKRIDNISFEQGDSTIIDTVKYGRFDIVLMMGLIYHLENPIGAIRNAAIMTKNVLLLETQISPGISSKIDWGTYHRQKKIEGVFSLIDETQEIKNPLSSITGFALCPSKDLVFWLLLKLGFSRVELVAVPEDGNEQLLSGKRIMVAAYK